MPQNSRTGNWTCFLQGTYQNSRTFASIFATVILGFSQKRFLWFSLPPEAAFALLPCLAAPSSGEGPGQGSGCSGQRPAGADGARLEQLCPGFSWGALNAFPAPATALSFGFRMQTALMLRWCFLFLLNPVYPKQGLFSPLSHGLPVRG